MALAGTELIQQHLRGQRESSYRPGHPTAQVQAHIVSKQNVADVSDATLLATRPYVTVQP